MSETRISVTLAAYVARQAREASAEQVRQATEAAARQQQAREIAERARRVRRVVVECAGAVVTAASAIAMWAGACPRPVEIVIMIAPELVIIFGKYAAER